MSISVSGTPLPGSYMRTRPVPVDTTSVWATYAQAAEYAANNGTDNYCPYDGQLVVTLAGYPEVSENSPKYTEAHLWRLKYLNETTVGGKKRQHFTLDEVKSGNAVAGTDVHNIYTGTQRFGSWIELLAGMTMGFNLVTGTNPDTGEPIIVTDPVTGKIQRYKDDGTIGDVQDNDERIWLDSQGHAHMVISAIKVLGTLEVSEIDVNHIKHSGGLFVNSRANIIVDSVEQLSGGRTKLTFVGQANGQTLFNLFEVGDLALSMTFNVLKEGASTPSEGKVVRWYWREVVAVDDTSITLAPQDASLPEMATPRKGDTVVQVGHVDAPEGADDDKKAHVASRQGLQVMGFSDTNGPYIAEYDGINSVAASVTFDDYEHAIVYLSPKKHKLQGDIIKLKAGQGGTDVEMTADTIKTITQNLSVIANILNIDAQGVSLRINGIEGDIALKADTATVNAKELDINSKIAKLSAGSLRLALNENGAVLQMLDANGRVVGNLGATLLISNTDGTMSGILNFTNGEWTFRDDFVISARNIDFTAGAININAAKFQIKNGSNVTMFVDDKLQTSYLDIGTLKAALINAGIINAGQILTDALSSGTNTFDAEGVTINNLTVSGNAVIGGTLDSAGGTFTGQLRGVGGTFEGVLKASMVYTRIINLSERELDYYNYGGGLGRSKSYVCDMRQEPAQGFMWLTNEQLVIELPSAADYDGLELEFYEGTIPAGARPPAHVCSLAVIASVGKLYGVRESSTGQTYGMVNGDGCWGNGMSGARFKAMNGNWYAMFDNPSLFDLS